MTPWSWYAGHPGEFTYDLAVDCASREDAIREALRELSAGETFQVIEARSSEASKHEGSDCVPFLRTRNHEVLTAGPHLLAEAGR
jgi:hypothetical protein